MTSTCGKKGRELALLHEVLRAVGIIPTSIDTGAEPPDLLVNLGSVRVGVELTEHHSSATTASISPRKGPLPRRALERAIEELFRAIETERARISELQHVNGWLAFQTRLIPLPYERHTFVTELLICASKYRPAAEKLTVTICSRSRTRNLPNQQHHHFLPDFLHLHRWLTKLRH